MIIWLGLQLDDGNCLPNPNVSTAGQRFFTPRAFVQWLEAYYGRRYPEGDVDYLRIEQYRQLCQQLLLEQPHLFYAAAFKADQRAAAEELLSRRDELISAGYPLAVSSKDQPTRLAVLSSLERLQLDSDLKLELNTGFADRLDSLIRSLTKGRHPSLEIRLHEPQFLLPPGLRRLLNALVKIGSTITPIEVAKVQAPDTDLGAFQSGFNAQNGVQSARADGSLIVLRARRETHLAAFLARTLKKSPNWRPNLLLSDRNPTFNNALSMEGLPDLGMAVSSLARPSLQVLKLVTSFLWEPMQLPKVMEFLNLIVKPFDADFARHLAASLAESPGIDGPDWKRAVARYFNEILPNRTAYNNQLDAKTLREQYNFWFNRRRYEQHEQIPKAEVRMLFTFLLNWAREAQSDLEGGDLVARQTLASQCQRLVELIDVLPEGGLSFLETERLVRAVYAPTPTTFQAAELGHLPTAYRPAAIYGQLSELIWWDFTEQDPSYFFSRWTNTELTYLKTVGIELLGPKQKSDRQLWQHLRPILHTEKRLVICLSDFVDGQEALPHPLFGDLEATFGDTLDRLTVQVDEFGTAANSTLSDFDLPVYQTEALSPLPLPQLGIRFESTSELVRKAETPTSLDKLIYYPHQYLFQYGLRWKTNELFSIASDNRLLGNLGHRMIETMLINRADASWNRQETYAFVADFLPVLLQQEGAPLLAYGREPDRVQFKQTMQQACWALNCLIQDNHWQVLGTELDLAGVFEDVDFKGRADLLLERDNELAIIDLKWRGKTTFRNLINNGEDLQLSLYANLVAANYRAVHTAYFIIKDGVMIARNDLAFKGLEPISPEEDHQALREAILAKLKATYHWRREQLAAGWLETRTETTAGALDDQYQDEIDLLDLLEMKQDDARWDDYWTLIGGVR